VPPRRTLHGGQRRCRARGGGVLPATSRPRLWLGGFLHAGSRWSLAEFGQPLQQTEKDWLDCRFIPCRSVSASQCYRVTTYKKEG
jgi:hypothetical protein